MQARFNSTGNKLTGLLSSLAQRRLGWSAGAMLFCVLLTGCADVMRLKSSSRLGPFYTPKNFDGDTALPASLHRVLVLPVYGGKVAQVEASQVLDEVLLSALQKKNRFEVVTVTREEIQRRFNQPEFSSAAVLPHGFLEDLGRAYGAEAVLFVDITVYAPYPPLAVGFRAKLATIGDVRLVWTFDETFSASDPAVSNSVQRASRQESSSQVPLDMTVGTFQSPRRFAAFAAGIMFDTLPPR